jgi:putative endonuclease
MFFVYLLSNKKYGTLYIGSTNDLLRRMWEHRNKVVPGFTNRYDVIRLVWFEPHESFEAVRLRERQIKKWRRDWKINLIERENPHWIDLYPSLTQ